MSSRADSGTLISHFWVGVIQDYFSLPVADNLNFRAKMSPALLILLVRKLSQEGLRLESNAQIVTEEKMRPTP